MVFLKRTIPLILVFCMGVTFCLQYFIPHPSSDKANEQVSNWISIVVGISLLLGLGSLIHVHWGRVKKQGPGWGYSLVLLLTLSGTTVLGFWTGIEDEKSAGMWMYMNIVRPCSATMFSILGFFIASAAFRAFRARNLEATLLLVAATIIMLGQTPLGYMISEHIPDLSSWILKVPNAAAKRAIIFGVALGVISTSLRIIFGIERSYLGGSRD